MTGLTMAMVATLCARAESPPAEAAAWREVTESIQVEASELEWLLDHDFRSEDEGFSQIELAGIRRRIDAAIEALRSIRTLPVPGTEFQVRQMTRELDRMAKIIDKFSSVVHRDSPRVDLPEPVGWLAAATVGAWEALLSHWSSGFAAFSFGPTNRRSLQRPNGQVDVANRLVARAKEFVDRAHQQILKIVEVSGGLADPVDILQSVDAIPKQLEYLFHDLRQELASRVHKIHRDGRWQPEPYPTELLSARRARAIADDLRESVRERLQGKRRSALRRQISQVEDKLTRIIARQLAELHGREETIFELLTWVERFDDLEGELLAHVPAPELSADIPSRVPSDVWRKCCSDDTGDDLAGTLTLLAESAAAEARWTAEILEGRRRSGKFQRPEEPVPKQWPLPLTKKLSR